MTRIADIKSRTAAAQELLQVAQLRVATRLIVAALILTGCVKFVARRGIEVAWYDQVVNNLRMGESTRADVLVLIGPPSRVIALEKETVPYHLFEKTEGEAAILMLYKSVDIGTLYDRAIFFFDDDVLSDYSAKICSHNGRSIATRPAIESGQWPGGLHPVAITNWFRLLPRAMYRSRSGAGR